MEIFFQPGDLVRQAGCNQVMTLQCKRFNRSLWGNAYQWECKWFCAKDLYHEGHFAPAELEIVPVAASETPLPDMHAIGDSVRLKSGGPAMQIVFKTYFSKLRACSWMCKYFSRQGHDVVNTFVPESLESALFPKNTIFP